MLHIIHDFFEDFDAAIRANDTIMLTDIITDELAKMVIFDKGKMNEALKKGSKIQFSEKTPDSVYVKELITRVKNEPALRKDLALLIIYNNSEKEVSEKDFTAGGRGKISKSKNIPENKRLEYIDKALILIIGKENEDLIKKKIKSHRKVKDMNFGIDAENVEEQKVFLRKEKIKLGIKVSVITSLILVGVYFGISWLAFKYGKKTVTPVAPIATPLESKPKSEVEVVK